MTTLVVGAGVFGVTAALALRRRGRAVTLLDPGPVPHPLAASTDISKVVRLEYGADEDWMVMTEQALDGWRRWNVAWGAPLFHETGVLFLSRGPLEPGGFEHDSLEALTRRGHTVERLDAGAVRARFPAWNADTFAWGYYNPAGGWAESAAVIARLVAEAVDAGVALAPRSAVAHLLETDARVTGVALADGTRLYGDAVIVASGAWTPHLLPWLAPHLRSVGQPVFHLAPADVAAFDPRVFPVFGADIAETGYYGFPATGGVVKIARHAVGREMHPESPQREVSDDETRALRAFVAATFPSLAAAAIAKTRVCMYCDTPDQQFWVAPDPDRDGLVVAAGGSGHAFKLAPLLGDWCADALEGRVLPRFCWRARGRADAGREATRCRT
jgi:glycine/D-amino acid oxidase-like deaminating enzyme